MRAKFLILVFIKDTFNGKLGLCCMMEESGGIILKAKGGTRVFFSRYRADGKSQNKNTIVEIRYTDGI